MDEQWTLAELVREAAERIAQLPAPRNGQIRAVPDDRTIRYYGTLGLVDKPAMRGRTAYYGRRHLAQIIAIKRLQTMGRPLSAIQRLLPGVDPVNLARMSGVAMPGSAPAAVKARAEFWKREPTAEPPQPQPAPITPEPTPADTIVPLSPNLMPAAPAVELRLELAPDIHLALAIPDGVAISPEDIRAIRAAAEPLVAELARRRSSTHAGEREDK